MNRLQRRKFTEAEKKAILEEASHRGINVVLHEHRLSYSVFSRWRSAFQQEPNPDWQSPHLVLQQLKLLMIENERLKKIIARQALELQIAMEGQMVSDESEFKIERKQQTL